MKEPSKSLQPLASKVLAGLRDARSAFRPTLEVREVGVVHTVMTGVARVSGLPGLGSEELVRFEGGAYGIAFNIDEKDSGIVLLSDSSEVETGTEVERTGRVTDVPVGRELLGRVVDPLGNPLDGGPPISSKMRLPVERPSPHIMDRAPKRMNPHPFATWINAVG